MGQRTLQGAGFRPRCGQPRLPFTAPGEDHRHGLGVDPGNLGVGGRGQEPEQVVGRLAARDAAAIIPPRKNARPWRADTAGAIARNEALRTSRRFGRTIWRRWSGYHRRSRAETKMHCVKLLGQRLTARDFDRQVAEFQVRVAVLNGFTALGQPVTEVVG